MEYNKSGSYSRAVYKKHMGFGYWVCAKFNDSMTSAQVWWSDNPRSKQTCTIGEDGTMKFNDTTISTDRFYI